MSSLPCEACAALSMKTCEPGVERTPDDVPHATDTVSALLAPGVTKHPEIPVAVWRTREMSGNAPPHEWQTGPTQNRTATAPETKCDHPCEVNEYPGPQKADTPCLSNQNHSCHTASDWYPGPK